MSRVGRGAAGGPAGGQRAPLLAIDTATRQAAIAIGDGRAEPLAARSWGAGYRHGEELLAVLDEVLHEAGIELRDLGGVVAGTGPGAFTGLRVGLATAKGLAYGLRVPIVGVASTAGLAVAAHAAARGAALTPVAVLLPAGPHDRYLARYRIAETRWPDPLGEPELVPAGEPLASRLAAMSLVAVDLPTGGEIDAAAVALGAVAQEGLGRSLLSLGAAALDAGRADDVAELVPAYVTLPRGITAQLGTIEWSRDHR
jgi:tRNA threonylcarbamoyl adenosine modification protein YeaZ